MPVATKPVAKPIPEGFSTVTPYMNVADAAAAIAFYTKVFGAREIMRMAMPDGKIIHAQIEIGDSAVMLADEHELMQNYSPETLNGTSVSFYLHVPDVDATFDLAIQEGATVVREVEDRFYGDRVGVLADPFGHIWSLAMHIEDVPQDEIRNRAAALFQSH